MEEIDARPDIIPVAKVTPPLCEGSDRSDSRCPTTESFDWNDQVERGRREIEFSSFPPGPFHRSCYHTMIALDSRTFDATITMKGLREQNNNMQLSRLSNERLVCSVNCLSSGNLIPAAYFFPVNFTMQYSAVHCSPLQSSAVQCNAMVVQCSDNAVHCIRLHWIEESS
ncbi:hypothetical protein ALC53_09583 [Atta colombica]|uniref:Uncharacterized protein n=1 Tax=Atta colombica TaxID=520822 RepID=A0A195B724_9HYME|nr:hypothetical protein ALC53_09583 [Atta colombica]